MMKANRATRLAMILTLVFLAAAGWPQDRAALDDLMDFDTTLKELTRSLETGSAAELRTDKFVILSGTLADILPKPSRPNFFLLSEGDFLDPQGFLLKVRRASDPVAALLGAALAAESRELLERYDPAQDSASSVLKPLLRDWNALLEGGLLSQQPTFRGVGISEDLQEILSLSPQGEDGQFANRLLLEAALPRDLRPITVTGKIVSGEWIWTDEIRSYQGLVEFSGADAYKLFLRRRLDDATSLMIPQNSRVLVVARLIRPVQGVQEESIWLAGAAYVRKMR